MAAVKPVAALSSQSPAAAVLVPTPTVQQPVPVPPPPPAPPAAPAPQSAAPKPSTPKATAPRQSTPKTGTPAAQPAQTTADAGDSAESAALAAAIVSTTNAVRAQNGLGALSTSGCLTGTARSWVRNMDANDLWSHSSLAGILSTCGFTYAAENLAKISGSAAPSASTVVNAWMNSAAHKANLLATQPTYIGVVARYDTSQNAWLIVQQFGRK